MKKVGVLGDVWMFTSTAVVNGLRTGWHVLGEIRLLCHIRPISLTCVGSP